METNGDSITTNEFSVEVNLVGPNLDPERVSSILGMTPTSAARTGDRRQTSRGEKLHEQGHWSHEVTSKDEIEECRDHQLVSLADTIAPHLEALRSAGVERIYFYYTLSSFLGILNVGLRSETMRKLADIGASLHISCFDCFNPAHTFWKNGVAMADGRG